MAAKGQPVNMQKEQVNMQKEQVCFVHLIPRISFRTTFSQVIFLLFFNYTDSEALDVMRGKLKLADFVVIPTILKIGQICAIYGCTLPF